MNKTRECRPLCKYFIGLRKRRVGYVFETRQFEIRKYDIDRLFWIVLNSDLELLVHKLKVRARQVVKEKSSDGYPKLVGVKGAKSQVNTRQSVIRGKKVQSNGKEMFHNPYKLGQQFAFDIEGRLRKACIL